MCVESTHLLLTEAPVRTFIVVDVKIKSYTTNVSFRKRVELVLLQLAQRVRAMRESKAVPAPVPVVQKIERKQTKGLNNLQSLPRGMECIDPLGLG